MKNIFSDWKELKKDKVSKEEIQKIEEKIDGLIEECTNKKNFRALQKNKKHVHFEDGKKKETSSPKPEKRLEGEKRGDFELASQFETLIEEEAAPIQEKEEPFEKREYNTTLNYYSFLEEKENNAPVHAKTEKKDEFPPKQEKIAEENVEEGWTMSSKTGKARQAKKTQASEEEKPVEMPKPAKHRKPEVKKAEENQYSQKHPNLKLNKNMLPGLMLLKACLASLKISPWNAQKLKHILSKIQYATILRFLIII